MYDSQSACSGRKTKEKQELTRVGVQKKQLSTINLSDSSCLLLDCRKMKEKEKQELIREAAKKKNKN